MFHWDDQRHSAFDDKPLRLASIAAADSFFYCIAEVQGIPCAVRGIYTDRKYHFFNKPLGYLGDLIAEDELLCAEFRDVTIAVRGVPFVVEAEEAGMAEVVGKLTRVTDVGPSDMILTDRTSQGLVVGFAVPARLNEEAQGWYSNAMVHHVMTGLIATQIASSDNFSTPVMLINSSRDLCELVCCNAGSLLFANHYRTTGPEDALYYVLAVLRQLNLSIEDIALQNTGPSAAATRQVLQGFFPRNEVTIPRDSIPAPEYPVEESWDLSTVLQCAS